MESKRIKYTMHSIALNDKEENDFQEIKQQTGLGVKKIFMTTIKTLKSSSGIQVVEEI